MGTKHAPTRTATKDKQALEHLLNRQHTPLRAPPQLAGRARPTGLDDVAGSRRRTVQSTNDVTGSHRRPVQSTNDVTGSHRRPMQPTVERPRRQSLFIDLPNDYERDAPMLSPIAQSRAALHEARMLDMPQISFARSAGSFGDMFNGRLWLMGVIAAISIVILLFLSSPQHTIISGIHLPGAAIAEQVTQALVPLPVAANGEHSILGAPSITAEQIDAVLTKYHSPAAGTGQLWIDLGKQYNINPAYALAFFIHESSAATAQGWAGWKPDGSSTHNVGNIICAGYATCYNRFRDYPGWHEGIEDWYRLIANEYVKGRNIFTIEQIIPVYAPSFENNVPAYVQTVTELVKQWQH